MEIGPGPGALTERLARAVRPLHVVEIDRELAAALRARFAPDAVVVHEGDALDFDFASLPADLRVVGNLPYNVSTPILFHVASFAPRIRDCVFMLQREVVERMVAEPGTAGVRPALGDAAVPLRDGARPARAARRLHAAAEGRLGRRAHGAARRGPARRARRGALRAHRDGGLHAAPQDAAQRAARDRRGRSLRAGRRRPRAARGDALGRAVRGARRCRGRRPSPSG